MLVPLSWLKEYVDIDVTPEELEKKLFDGGFEVEERYQVGKDISNVVVGLVESCEPIPETHLHVCQVNAGEHGTMQICCGATTCAPAENSRLPFLALLFMQQQKIIRPSRVL